MSLKGRLVALDRAQERKKYPALFLDYRDGREETKKLYTYHYKDETSYKDKKDWLDTNFSDLTRQTLTKTLLAYNETLNVSEETRDNIKLLCRAGTQAVVTGQQAGIIGGPLYTFYKAAAAVNLAKKITRERGFPVVPVFWIAAEDHDFREANQVKVQQGDGSVAKLEMSLKSSGQPLEYLSLSDSAVHKLIADLSDATPETEFKDEVVEFLRESGLKSTSLTQWFGRVMAWLFQGSGLIFFNPLLPELRPLASSLLSSLCRERERVDRCLAEREELLASMDYHLQVKREEGQLNLFAFLEGGRASLLWDSKGVTTRQGESMGSCAELAGKIAAEPLKYGPGVLTRPLLQEALLPTLSYVAGPGEVSYFAQLMPLFKLFNLRAPVIYPRPSVTLLEPRLSGFQEKYSLSDRDIFEPQQALSDYLKRQGSDRIVQVFSQLEDKVQREYRILEDELASINKGLKGLTRKNLKRVLDEIEYLKGKGEQAFKEKNQVAVRHFLRLERACMPDGQLQERTFTIFSFIIKYGPSFASGLRSRISEAEGHYIHRW